MDADSSDTFLTTAWQPRPIKAFTTMSMTHATNLTAIISELDPALGEALQRVENGWRSGTPEDAAGTEQLASTLIACIDSGLFSAATMVEGFKAFAEEFFAHQIECLRSGSYRAKDYEAVRQQVYANDEYMATTYYPSLLLSYVASPNYRHLWRSLEQTLARWQCHGVRRIVDIASGHGLLLLQALRALPEASGVGVDISPVAARFAASLQQITGWGAGRLEHRTLDLLTAAPANLGGPFDAAICCELLEHIPNPEAFLNKIRATLVPGGRLFVSAAVRMESVDHLTFFSTTEEVAAMLDREGFDVAVEMSVPFVNRRPSDAAKWARMLADRTVPATYVAECTARA